MLLRHFAYHLTDQDFTRLKKLVKGHRVVDHPFETALVFRRDIEARWRKNLGHGAMVAEKVDDEGLTEGVVHAFIEEQVPHLEQVAWVLAVEGGEDLAGLQVGEADDLHIGIP